MTEPFQAGPFIGGVNNRLADHAMVTPDGVVDKLRLATNAVLDDTGKLYRREGFTLGSPDAGAHSGFGSSTGILYVAGGFLKLYDPNNGTTTPLATLVSNQKMAYAEVNGEVYYSNSVDTGKVANGVRYDWGVAIPNGGMTLAAATGALYAGTYQACLTYETAAGEESGASLAAAITLASGQGIAITGIPAPPAGVAFVNVYCTMVNGDIFYKVAKLVAGATTFNHTVHTSLGAQLATQFMTPPPAGNVLAYSCGRIYTAYGRVVCYTEPLAYGLYRPSRNFLYFPSDVKIMVGVLDGLYVVADKTYFLAGGNPKDHTSNPVLPYSGAFGSACRAPDEEDAWFWYGDRGLVKAGRGGAVKALQESSLSLDPAGSGSSLFMEQNGIKRVVSLSAPGGYTAAAAARGYVEMEVRRKGA